MPLYKNNSNAAVIIGGVQISPSQTKAVAAYVPTHYSEIIEVIDSEPKVQGVVFSARQVSNETYDIPYYFGFGAVNVIAKSDIAFSFADSDVIINLTAGDMYRIRSVLWDFIGKITVEGTAYILVERGE